MVSTKHHFNGYVYLWTSIFIYIYISRHCRYQSYVNCCPLLLFNVVCHCPKVEFIRRNDERKTMKKKLKRIETARPKLQFTIFMWPFQNVCKKKKKKRYKRSECHTLHWSGLAIKVDSDWNGIIFACLLATIDIHILYWYTLDIHFVKNIDNRITN